MGTHFLRVRRGEPERSWVRDNGPVTKGDALAALRGCVLLVEHPYERHPQSGAGNCWCGREQVNSLHDVMILDPAEFVPCEHNSPHVEGCENPAHRNPQRAGDGGAST